jgi:HK97 family phage major capsid protein
VAYMMHPAVLRVLRAMVNTDGLPVFPELRSGNVLCGFPVVPNVSMPSSLTATAKAIVFGNFAQAVVIRDVIPSFTLPCVMTQTAK